MPRVAVYVFFRCQVWCIVGLSNPTVYCPTVLSGHGQKFLTTMCTFVLVIQQVNYGFFSRHGVLFVVVLGFKLCVETLEVR